MKKNTLKFWRLIIPGIIIILLAIPAFTKTAEELKNLSLIFQTINWQDSIILGIMIIIGAIYYSINGRWIVWKHFNKKVQDNIKERILTSCSLKFTYEKWNKLKEGRSLMTIFYHFVDTDRSLTDKAEDVRHNGLIWSTCFDITILTGIAGYTYLIIAVLSVKDYLIYVSAISFALSFIFLGFSSLLTYKHLKLSNEQLDVISQKYKNEVDEKIQEVIDAL